jgi:ketosteroid isomerase-like protein
MSARDDFLAWVSTELRAAETAVHNGDAGLRREIWSRTEPVTVFGAARNAVGRSELDDLFSMLEGKFSGCRSYRYDLVAAEVVDDMAYTVGHEHTQATVDGEPRAYTLRVTQVYRRHSGEWKVVHRHADTAPEQATSSGQKGVR